MLSRKLVETADLHNNIEETLKLLKDITLSYYDIQDECEIKKDETPGKKIEKDETLGKKIEAFENQYEDKISLANRYCYYLFLIKRTTPEKLNSNDYDILITNIDRYSELIYTKLNKKNPNYHGMCQILTTMSPKIRAMHNDKEFSFIKDKLLALHNNLKVAITDLSKQTRNTQNNLADLTNYCSAISKSTQLEDQISLLQEDYEDLIATQDSNSYGYAYALRLDERISEIQREVKKPLPTSFKETYNSFATQLNELRSDIFRKIFFGPLLENGSNEFFSSLRQALTELDHTTNEVQNKISPKWWEFWKKSKENSHKQQIATKENIVNIIQNQEIKFSKKLAEIDNLNKDGNIKDFSTLRAKAYFIVSLAAFYKGEIDIVGLSIMLKKMAKIDSKSSKLFTQIEQDMTAAYSKYASQYITHYANMESDIENRPSPIRFIKRMQEEVTNAEKNRDDIENKIKKLNFWNIFQRSKLNAKKTENNTLLSESNGYLTSLKSGNPYAVANTIQKILEKEGASRMKFPSVTKEFPSVAPSP